MAPTQLRLCGVLATLTLAVAHRVDVGVREQKGHELGARDDNIPRKPPPPTSHADVPRADIPREYITVDVADAKECQREVNSQIWRAFDERYGPQVAASKPPTPGPGACDLIGREDKRSAGVLPRYVLHGTSGNDPARWGGQPAGKVDFRRLRSGFQTVTVDAPHRPGETLDALHWTAAYAFDGDSGKISAKPGFVGIWRADGCGRDACWVEKTGLLAMKYASSCAKAESEFEIGKDAVFTGSLRGEDSKICSSISYCEGKSSDVIVFFKSDTCELVLDAVFEVRCVTPAVAMNAE